MQLVRKRWRSAQEPNDLVAGAHVAEDPIERRERRFVQAVGVTGQCVRDQHDFVFELRGVAR